MSLYEYTYIARQDIQPQQVDAITTEFAKIITDNGGKVAKTESWGLRTLAYRIKKYKKGHYVHLNLDAPHAAIAELERNARLHEDVIRYMTIRVDEFEEGDSVVLRSKDRDNRAPREDRRPREEKKEGAE
ncbi:MAG: 30S ribosomal protein S6 [Emcibacteraceae bacterium]|jgi:small subunit ribosomal protein S6|uniref:30S ribosomal protein S6 n=1 Tax=Pseudemcibacter sp. TaxID=2943293 RepID=UPI0023088748|nr:30S ribosomal protein S6 [Kordiimonadaceae bacterium]MDA9552910.1 30S ribosomal protein S6 [Emcibacteraceae bacterium]MDC1090429.1 30S ribosomal protein S6 [Emcibacteraceae bacterium]MDG1021037.1 30S ribosomal protein S6 [Emcibacteraceae bacterium]MDG1727969.1 30S ribosomal protein S6 [Emcibacteraceae bacterium]